MIDLQINNVTIGFVQTRDGISTSFLMIAITIDMTGSQFINLLVESEMIYAVKQS